MTLFIHSFINLTIKTRKSYYVILEISSQNNSFLNVLLLAIRHLRPCGEEVKAGLGTTTAIKTAFTSFPLDSWIGGTNIC